VRYHHSRLKFKNSLHSRRRRVCVCVCVCVCVYVVGVVRLDEHVGHTVKETTLEVVGCRGR
jgi:hypothetical protein